MKEIKDTRLITLVDRSMMKAIEAASKKEETSVAEIVRRAIQEWLKRNA
jgi:hypothetical protein